MAKRHRRGSSLYFVAIGGEIERRGKGPLKVAKGEVAEGEVDIAASAFAEIFEACGSGGWAGAIACVEDDGGHIVRPAAFVCRANGGGRQIVLHALDHIHSHLNGTDSVGREHPPSSK